MKDNFLNKEIKAPKSRVRKIVLCVLLIILLLAGTVAGCVYYFTKDYNYNKIEKEPEKLGFEKVKQEQIINIALFGIDTRSVNSFSGRSDTIMILSLNTKTNKIKLVSVMRDSFVPIDKKGKITHSKINSAYSSGGPELAIKTLNTVFDLDISEYVAVNFYKLADIIDSVGGIEVTLTKNEVEHVNSGAKNIYKVLKKDTSSLKDVTAGTQLLNGAQAVSYARIRYVSNSQGTTNDYGRTDRQRYIMQQLLNKVLSMEKTKYIGLIKPILASCETSLTYGEVLDVAIPLLSEKPQFSETRVPDTSYIMTPPKTKAGAIVYYDLNFAAKLIHSFIYEDITPEEYIAQKGVEKNNWYATGFTRPDIQHEGE